MAGKSRYLAMDMATAMATAMVAGLRPATGSRKSVFLGKNPPHKSNCLGKCTSFA